MWPRKLLAENTPEQINNWLVKHVQQVLAISGDVDDRRSTETNLGGFKQTNVGLDFNLDYVSFLFLTNCCPSGLPFTHRLALQFHAQKLSLLISFYVLVLCSHFG